MKKHLLRSFLEWFWNRQGGNSMDKKTRTNLYRLLGPVYRVAVNAYSLFDQFYQYSYAQEGEDLILRSIFRNVNSGFYVDVGAYHPYQFSNTYLFYRLGWHGINIDAMPGSMKSFRSRRKRDINIEAMVSDTEAETTFYCFNQPALNTFSKELALDRERINKFKIIDQKKVCPQRLDAILDQYLPLNQKIDFISIDVEGHELAVLHSNNWSQYHPNVAAIELLGTDMNGVMKHPVHKYMGDQGYYLFAKTANTAIYLSVDFKVSVYE